MSVDRITKVHLVFHCHHYDYLRLETGFIWARRDLG